jgi:hypothetical protein
LQRAKQTFAKMAAWLATCTAYYEAAGQYEELSRLSDADLERRGLSRDTLAKDICEAADRESRP